MNVWTEYKRLLLTMSNFSAINLLLYDLFYFLIVAFLFSASSMTCHPDWKVTKRMILAKFTWPKVGQKIKMWCKECLQCQQNKNSRHTKPKTCQINDGITRFSHIHLDIVGPLSAIPDSPHRYPVTFTDRMTKWVRQNLYHQLQLLL